MVNRETIYGMMKELDAPHYSLFQTIFCPLVFSPTEMMLASVQFGSEVDMMFAQRLSETPNITLGYRRAETPSFGDSRWGLVAGTKAELKTAKQVLIRVAKINPFSREAFLEAEKHLDRTQFPSLRAKLADFYREVAKTKKEDDLGGMYKHHGVMPYVHQLFFIRPPIDLAANPGQMDEQIRRFINTAEDRDLELLEGHTLPQDFDVVSELDLEGLLAEPATP